MIDTEFIYANQIITLTLESWRERDYDSVSALQRISNLNYSEDDIERICMLPRSMVSELIQYALLMLERPYESDKCCATKFLSLSFRHKTMLDEFDEQGGLNKLCDVLLNIDRYYKENLGRDICFALKSYMESHLFFKYNGYMSPQYLKSKATKVSPEQLIKQIGTLQQDSAMCGRWALADQLLESGCISMLLKIVELGNPWSYDWDCEAVCSALYILSACCVIPSVVCSFCESTNHTSRTGFDVILKAAVGEIAEDCEVRKSALAVLCHCVCFPIASREEEELGKHNKCCKDQIERIWKAVRKHNGIFTLLSFLKNETRDFTDYVFDQVYRALFGLTRSPSVQEILNKLAFCTSGPMQQLISDPKPQLEYGFKLIQRIRGRSQLKLCHPKPNPLPGSQANLLSRILSAQSGFNTVRLDQQYVHRHFTPYRTIGSNGFVKFTCCDIVKPSNLVILGTAHGVVTAINIHNGKEQFFDRCHDGFVNRVRSHSRGDLAFTVCYKKGIESPRSILWSIRDNRFVSLFSIDNKTCCEFSNTTQDKLLVDDDHACAAIYDINTCSIISSFKRTTEMGCFRLRPYYATFNSTDDQIFMCNTLWDVRSGEVIHTFDKLSDYCPGVFHPNGREVICNSEIWDLRTYRLLQIAPELSQCELKFSPFGFIYGMTLDAPAVIKSQQCYEVVDSYNFSRIATIDVGNIIYDMSLNDKGTLLALLETPSITKQRTFLKIYALGTKKNNEHKEAEVQLEGPWAG